MVKAELNRAIVETGISNDGGSWDNSDQKADLEKLFKNKFPEKLLVEFYANRGTDEDNIIKVFYKQSYVDIPIDSNLTLYSGVSTIVKNIHYSAGSDGFLTSFGIW